MPADDDGSGASATPTAADGREPADARLAPTIGLLAAGLGLATTFVTGAGTDATVQGLPAALGTQVLAVVAALAFFARRHGLLSVRVGGAVAGLASLGLVAGGVLTMVEALSVWRQPLGVPVVAVAGGVAAGMGLADLRRLDDAALVRVLGGLGVALGLAAMGFIVANVVGGLLAGFALQSLGVTGWGGRYVVLTIAVSAGLLFFAWLVYRAWSRDWAALDLRWPTLRDLAWVVVGFLALQALMLVIDQIITTFDVPFAPSQVQRQAAQVENPEFVLLLIPLSFLAIAPGEEVVYRNVVQGYLYESMGRLPAVVAASGAFAAIHLFQYASREPGATLVSLTVIFALALVLGAVYERTENLVVPILLHGLYNAVSFWQIYVAVT